jgi:hypothetical protein
MGGVSARNDSVALMTVEERQMVTALCARIADERNPVAFRHLLIELDALLEKVTNHQEKRTGFEGQNA